jgi:hypothetical protein
MLAAATPPSQASEPATLVPVMSRVESLLLVGVREEDMHNGSHQMLLVLPAFPSA